MKKFIMCAVLAAVLLGGWHSASAQSVDLSYLQSLLNNLASQVAQVGSINKAIALPTPTVDSLAGSGNPGGGCAGGATMPAGSMGQMIYCNGSRWVASSVLMNSGGALVLTNMIRPGAGPAYLCIAATGKIYRGDGAGCGDTVSSLLSATNFTATITPVANPGGPVTRGIFNFGFTLVNSSNSAVYVSKNVADALTSNITGPGTNQSAFLNTSTPTEDPADTSTSYAIPAGTSRRFNYAGTIESQGTGLVRLRVGGLYYGFSAAAPVGNILSSGFEALQATINF